MVQKAYGDDQADASGSWVLVPVRDLIGDSADGCPPRVTLFVRRFESSSPDFEDFLHDPLRNMLMNPGDIKGTVDGWPDFPGDDDPNDPRENVVGGRLQEIRDDPRWAVHTNVVNHHRKLSRVHVMAMAGMTDPPSTGSISITLFKDATPHP
jgi:hypothetical protein